MLFVYIAATVASVLARLLAEMSILALQISIFSVERDVFFALMWWGNVQPWGAGLSGNSRGQAFGLPGRF